MRERRRATFFHIILDCREKKKEKKYIHALAYVVRNLYPTCTLLILMLVCINLLYVEAYYTVNLYIT